MRGLLLAIVLGAVGIGRALATASLPPALAIHAALMIAAWGALIPLGGIVARHFKVLPGQRFPEVVDDPFWWDWHRGLQCAGMGAAALGLAIVVWEARAFVDTAHARCGLVVMGLSSLQLLSPLWRGTKGGPTDDRANPADPATWRGDHYDMTRRRRLFEAWHKTIGWVLIGLADVTILLGIDLAGAPAWLLLVAGLLQSAVLFGLLDGRLKGRWVDTHAALWGPGGGAPLAGGPTSRTGGRTRRSPPA